MKFLLLFIFTFNGHAGSILCEGDGARLFIQSEGAFLKNSQLEFNNQIGEYKFSGYIPMPTYNPWSSQSRLVFNYVSGDLDFSKFELYTNPFGLASLVLGDLPDIEVLCRVLSKP